MSLTDSVFIFAFLPISLIGVFLPHIVQRFFLLGLSLFFYACGSPDYFFLFICLVCVNTLLAYLISFNPAAGSQKTIRGRALLVLGILINVLVLFYYKYTAFTFTWINDIFHTDFEVPKLLLPLGISFFTFKSISLLADAYNGKICLKKDPSYVALYLSFFGQITSGPIARYNEFYQYDFGGKVDLKGFCDRFSRGGYLYLRGFCKKILLANTLSLIVTEIFSADPAEGSMPYLWLGAIAFSLQLYYDFSGYSDMAIGIGHMYGIHCEENFNYPYCSKSISEFWRRWHISLGTWFKNYIYFPMGGSRVGSKARLYFNLFIVWLLTGIWHGANWTFIFWGLAYFVFIAFEKGLDIPNRFRTKAGRAFYHLFTLLIVNFQWVIFNSESLSKGLRYILYMFRPGGSPLASARVLVLLQEYGLLLLAALLFTVPVIPWLKAFAARRGKAIRYTTEALMALALILLFIFAVSFVIAGQNNPFLYGNF